MWYIYKGGSSYFDINEYCVKNEKYWVVTEPHSIVNNITRYLITIKDFQYLIEIHVLNKWFESIYDHRTRLINELNY